MTFNKSYLRPFLGATGEGCTLPFNSLSAQALKEMLVSRGLTAQAWRFMMRQSKESSSHLADLVIAPVMKKGTDHELKTSIRIVNELARSLQNEPLIPGLITTAVTQITRLIGLSKEFRDGSDSSDAVREGDPRANKFVSHNAAVLLRAMMRSEEHEIEQSEVIEQAYEVGDYIRAVPHKLTEMTWNALMVKTVRYHQEQQLYIEHLLRAQGQPRENEYMWKAVLGKVSHEKMQAIELCSTTALAMEAKAMAHCAASYDYQCFKGASHIFSIREGGACLATLEIARDFRGQWQIQQLKGLRNGRIKDPSIEKFANHLLAMFISKKRQGDAQH